MFVIDWMKIHIDFLLVQNQKEANIDKQMVLGTSGRFENKSL